MNSLFSHLLDDFQNNQHFLPLSIPADFEEKIIERSQGSLALKSVAYYLEGFGELRSVNIHSQKIDIINCFFYPLAKWHLPIYAMEFVTLGKKPIVGVLDLPCVSGKEHLAAQSLMHDLLAKYQFEPSNDYPIWYQECRSTYDIFTRPESFMVFENLAQAHRDIINTLPQFTKQTFELTTTEHLQHQKNIRAYQEHHLINSPGLTLMNNMFSETWTNSFLKEWFFAESILEKE